ncbi:hypothetical protein MARINOS108_11818 [Marinoscillum sp. 108]|nr:hypothetical protein MARINOS108_11818 [Marinoscillum sp. 108]
MPMSFCRMLYSLLYETAEIKKKINVITLTTVVKIPVPLDFVHPDNPMIVKSEKTPTIYPKNPIILGVFNPLSAIAPG